MAFNAFCDTTQMVTLTAAPSYADPNTGAPVPASIDGALRISVVSGDGTFTQDPATPLSFTVVSGAALADTVYQIQGDADLSAEVEGLITEQVVLTVSAAPPPPTPQASAFGFTAAAPVPKP